MAATLLLLGSNVFMTFAWYARLKNLAARPWYVAALCILAAVYFVFRSPGNTG
jgi:uncharacterized protein (DUF486 family)